MARLLDDMTSDPPLGLPVWIALGWPQVVPHPAACRRRGPASASGGEAVLSGCTTANSGEQGPVWGPQATGLGGGASLAVGQRA